MKLKQEFYVRFDKIQCKVNNSELPFSNVNIGNKQQC